MSVVHRDVLLMGTGVHVESTLLEGFPGVKERFVNAATEFGPMQRSDMRFYQLGIMVPGHFEFGCMVYSAVAQCDW